MLSSAFPVNYVHCLRPGTFNAPQVRGGTHTSSISRVKTSERPGFVTQQSSRLKPSKKANNAHRRSVTSLRSGFLLESDPEGQGLPHSSRGLEPLPEGMAASHLVTGGCGAPGRSGAHETRCRGSASAYHGDWREGVTRSRTNTPRARSCAHGGGYASGNLQPRGVGGGGWPLQR